jgi:hypothetical protein
VSIEMRRKLDEEAERSGRTVGQVVEKLLGQALALNSLHGSGPAITDEIALMLRFAQAVVQEEGDPLLSPVPREMLRHGWSVIASRALQRGRDDAARHAVAVGIAAQQALYSLPDCVLNDPRFPTLRKTLADIGYARLDFDSPQWADAQARVTETGRIVWDGFFGPNAEWAEEDDLAPLHLVNVGRLMRMLDEKLEASDAKARGLLERTAELLVHVGAIARNEAPAVLSELDARCERQIAEAQSLLGRDHATE